MSRSENGSETAAARAGGEVVTAVISSCVLGGFSALADWIWSRYLRDGALLPALVHGVLIFLLLALVLGRASGRSGATARLIWTLPCTGFAIAAAFYPLARAAGYLGALLVTWVGMWLSLALLQRWALRTSESLSGALSRGTLAALGSGLAFWSVSGMWTDPAFTSDNLLRFVYWSFAFLPGFLPLLLRREPGN